MCGAWSVDGRVSRTDCVADYAESRLAARTQRNADGRVHGTAIGSAADDGANEEGNGARAPSVKAVPHGRLTLFAAAMVGVAVGGVYLVPKPSLCVAVGAVPVRTDPIDPFHPSDPHNPER